MSARIDSSWASLGLRMSPRSPPVHVTTRTRWPSATYRAIVAAPLLDSSSGCACTAMRRNCSLTVFLLIWTGTDSRPSRHLGATHVTCAMDDNGRVSTPDDEQRAALEERYGAAPDAATRRRRRLVLAVLAILAVVAFVVLAVVSTDEAVRTEDAAFTVVDDSAV